MEPQTAAPPPTPDIADHADALIEAGQGVIGQAESLLAMFMRPWNGYQLAIIIGAFVLAHGLRAVLGPRLRRWIKTREDWPKARLRLMAVIHKRLRLILLVVLLWSIWAVMQETTWPSRSYMIGVAARLTSAWLIIALTARVIRNSAMRAVVRALGIGWASLSILGISAPAIAFLDSLAIEMGALRLSLWMIIQGVLIITLLFLGARFMSQTAAQRIHRAEHVSPSMRVLSIKLMQVVLYGLALSMGLKAIGVDLTGLAVLSGAVGVGLGFGLQKVVSNLVSGVILLLDKSIKPGDVISLGDTFGWINTLGARYVSITTRDGKEYLIPNEDLITGQVVNWSHSDDFVRLDIYFGTAYGDDPHKVRRIATQAAAGVDRVLSARRPVCHIVGFGDSSVDYILRFWISDPSAGLTNIRGNVYLALWDAFAEHEISIPFPQREVRMLPEAQKPLD